MLVTNEEAAYEIERKLEANFVPGNEFWPEYPNPGDEKTKDDYNEAYCVKSEVRENLINPGK